MAVPRDQLLGIRASGTPFRRQRRQRNAKRRRKRQRNPPQHPPPVPDHRRQCRQPGPPRPGNLPAAAAPTSGQPATRGPLQPRRGLRGARERCRGGGKPGNRGRALAGNRIRGGGTSSSTSDLRKLGLSRRAGGGRVDSPGMDIGMDIDIGGSSSVGSRQHRGGRARADAPRRGPCVLAGRPVAGGGGRHGSRFDYDVDDDDDARCKRAVRGNNRPAPEGGRVLASQRPRSKSPPSPAGAGTRSARPGARGGGRRYGSRTGRLFGAIHRRGEGGPVRGHQERQR
mmetsp:Transcript_26308/g.72283  ORF Transcript_26308/g.72283 Transcript_26308/m.72283 type:complete len:284 (+) Transcript_26308:291-1142(+)